MKYKVTEALKLHQMLYKLGIYIKLFRLSIMTLKFGFLRPKGVQRGSKRSKWSQKGVKNTKSLIF